MKYTIEEILQMQEGQTFDRKSIWAIQKAMAQLLDVDKYILNLYRVHVNYYGNTY